MKTVDFSNYEFRCHALGKIMTGVKPALTDIQAKTLMELRIKLAAGKITDKQIITLGELMERRDAVPTLSATTKSYLKELHAQEVFGKKKTLQSRYLDKGLMAEEHGITLYSEVTGQLFLKNRERRGNGMISGECDNKQGRIRDIKCSWDLDTFPLHENELGNKDYWWQMQGYMELWDMDIAEVIFVLVDTPDMLIDDAKRQMLYRIPEMELPQDLEDEIENTMRFADMPKKLRVRSFTVERDRDAIAMLYDQIGRCRAYLNDLSVELYNRLSDDEAI